MGISSRIGQEFRNFGLLIRSCTARIKAHFANDVPFVCQFATPESAELSLTQKLRAIDDPDWALSGARSSTRYADWAFTMCGMACTAMVLEYFRHERVLPAILAEDALDHGVYQEHGGELSAMRYKEYVRWIARYGLKAHIFTRLTISGIRYLISKGDLVIVSVNPNIRGYETAPRAQEGGHLVLVTGYDLKHDTITINNPSGFASTSTQKGHTMPTREFLRFFAGRGISLSPADPAV